MRLGPQWYQSVESYHLCWFHSPRKVALFHSPSVVPCPHSASTYSALALRYSLSTPPYPHYSCPHISCSLPLTVHLCQDTVVLHCHVYFCGWLHPVHMLFVPHIVCFPLYRRHLCSNSNIQTSIRPIDNVFRNIFPSSTSPLAIVDHSPLYCHLPWQSRFCSLLFNQQTDTLLTTMLLFSQTVWPPSRFGPFQLYIITIYYI